MPERTKISDNLIEEFIAVAELTIESGEFDLLTDWPFNGIEAEALARICEAVRAALGVSGTIQAMGSARYGFSMAPHKLFDVYDVNISDIDLITTDRQLFDKLWLSLQDVKKSHTWNNGRFESFKSYLLKGWIRLDFMPHTAPEGLKVWEKLNQVKAQEECAKITLGMC